MSTKRQSMLVIVSGPSGVGKTTIVQQLVKQLDATLSISLTTRPKAASDIEAVDYYFVDQQTFDQRRDAGDLLEWATVFGNSYGTPRQSVKKALDKGRIVILEIDVQGAVQVKKNWPDAFSVFVLPPSENVLLERLRKRKRESEEVIQHRFQEATDEINQAKACGIYDLLLINDKLEHAVSEAVCRVRQTFEKRS